MVDTPNRIVVIGGGLAGAKGVEALRDQGYTGRLTLVAEESELPYERPPLSKGYLQGKAEFESAVVHPRSWYATKDVELRLGVGAMSIDREKKVVTLSDGDLLPYDKLLLATGAVPRPLDVPGAAAVKYLRTRYESDVLKASFGDGTRVVVVGGGWIGLEVAAAAREAGSTVTLVESARLPLLDVLGPELAEVFAALHRDHGVDLRLKAELESISVDDELEADLVVAGVGVVPEDSLARIADLQVDNGILVSSSLRTSDPDIYAAGDVANQEHPLLRRRIRVEHWANALNQPAVAAAAMLGAGSASYNNLPYFYSDQFDLGMEYVGYAGPDDYERVVVRGDKEAREFVAFWLDGDSHILAAMNVNVWDVVDVVKPMIAERRVVDPERLADTSVDLADL